MKHDCDFCYGLARSVSGLMGVLGHIPSLNFIALFLLLLFSALG